MFRFASDVFMRGLLWCFADMLLAYHAHVRLAWQSAQTGMLLLGTTTAGTLANLLIGWLTMRYRFDGRAIVILQRHAMIACAVCFALQFAPIAHVAWLICWAILFRIAFEAVAIPQAMLMVWLPHDDAEAGRFVTINTAFAALARVVTALLSFAVAGEGMQASSAGWEWGLAILLGTGAILSAQLLGDRGDIVPSASAASAAPTLRGAELPDGIVWIMLATAIHAALLYLLARLLIFTPAQPGWGAPGPALLLALTLGMTCGPLATSRIAALRGEHGLAAIMAALVAAALLYLRLPDGPAPALAMTGIYGTTLSASATLLWSALTMRTRGTNRAGAGLAFSGFALAIKLGMAIGGGLTGLFLDGYVEGSDVTAARIAMLIALGALGCAFAWWALHRPRSARRNLGQEEMPV